MIRRIIVATVSFALRRGITVDEMDGLLTRCFPWRGGPLWRDQIIVDAKIRNKERDLASR